MTVEEVRCSATWTKDDDKAFENALANFPEETSDRWERIVENVPGKTLEEIKHHYDVLIDDVSRIESGVVPLPSYNNSCSEGSIGCAGDEGTRKKGGHVALQNCDSQQGSKGSRSDQERRKGIAWTEDEHRLFLLGLDKYGKGDWRSISRNFVVTRTPTQVASHAQKYFIRLNSMNKDRRRSSIHDITSVGNADLSSPVTGGAAAKSAKPSPPNVGVYVTPSVAVGTPAALPSPSHIGYGSVVTGAPVTYPMPPTTANR